jgi:uncharacterized protein (DUF2147 family)
MKKMITRFSLCIVLFFVSFFTHYVFAATTNSPVGLWKTIDESTKKPKAIMQIWESPTKVLSGRVLRIFPLPGFDQNELCTACEGEKHNKRIVGMVIMENLKQNTENPLEWTGGKILDPKNGKTYNVSIQVVDNGQKLNVRGYIGMPLFGRTQTWLSVAKAE